MALASWIFLLLLAVIVSSTTISSNEKSKDDPSSEIRKASFVEKQFFSSDGAECAYANNHTVKNRDGNIIFFYGDTKNCTQNQFEVQSYRKPTSTFQNLNTGVFIYIENYPKSCQNRCHCHCSEIDYLTNPS